jgi:hypothetical protein
MNAIGRAGPVCRHAFARPYNSNGGHSLQPFGHPGGTSKGKGRGRFRGVKGAQGRLRHLPHFSLGKSGDVEPVDLSETAGAEAARPRLNPGPSCRESPLGFSHSAGRDIDGASIDGEETQFCAAARLRQFGSNLGYPFRGCLSAAGGRISGAPSCPVRIA